VRFVVINISALAYLIHNVSYHIVLCLDCLDKKRQWINYWQCLNTLAYYAELYITEQKSFNIPAQISRDPREYNNVLLKDKNLLSRYQCYKTFSLHR